MATSGSHVHDALRDTRAVDMAALHQRPRRKGAAPGGFRRIKGPSITPWPLRPSAGAQCRYMWVPRSGDFFYAPSAMAASKAKGARAPGISPCPFGSRRTDHTPPAQCIMLYGRSFEHALPHATRQRGQAVCNL
eukprot:7245698-Prymnesium_polylepis.1